MSICLNMIVKNEARIITRLLESVCDIIDYWVICDTGSTDNTCQIILDFFKKKKIIGDLHRRPWKNFGYNRNEALRLARNRCDYLLLLDADMILNINGFDKSKLNKDSYMIKQRNGTLEYYNTRLIKSDLDWKCIGVTHEYYDVYDRNLSKQNLDTLWVTDIGDGGCKQNKFNRDIALLEQGIRDEPQNQRYYFYLAQSYKDINKNHKAIENYLKRISFGGWKEEVWYSYYMIGNCYYNINDKEKAVFNLLKAYDYYPTRAENIYLVAKIFRENKNYILASHFLDMGSKIPFPANDILFIRKDIYDYLFDYEKTIINFYINKKEEGKLLSDHLLYNKDLTYDVKKIIKNNQIYYVDKIKTERVLDNNPLYKGEDTIKLDVSVDEHYNIMNPSIIQNDDIYIINIRAVNFKIDSEGKYRIIKSNNYINSDEPVSTKNYLCIFNKRFEIVDQSLIDESHFRENHNLIDSDVKGIEDIRYFQYNKELWAVGTSRELRENWLNKMVLFKIDGNKIVHSVVLHNYNDSMCQKNWSPFIYNGKLLLVYAFQPLVILEPNLETGECTVFKEIKTKNYFEDIKGGTCGVRAKGEYYFLTHEVRLKENKRVYFHRFMVLNNDLELSKYSDLFYLEDIQIEFVIGMTYHNNEFLISWGKNDAEALVSKIKYRNITFHAV